MTLIEVRAGPGSGGTLTVFGKTIRCALGKGGLVAVAAKREGDGATPIGEWPLLGVLLRPDVGLVPPAGLPWRWLRPADGWSDDPADPAYNRPVSHPHAHGAERLWRDDHCYDIIGVLGHNSDPVVPGRGSAIFWHVAHPDCRPTEGCIAIEAAAFRALLPRLQPGICLKVQGDNLDKPPPPAH